MNYEVLEINKMTGAGIYQAMEEIKYRMIHGYIDYRTAVEHIQPLVDEINKRYKVIAAKHGRNYKPIKANSILR